MSLAARDVVVVDDEPGVRELVAKVVARLGHRVRTADSGERGLELLAEAHADLLIIDKNMPHMHGAEAIAIAREKFPSLTVILMTAYPEPFALPPQRLEGYLAKPFKNLQVIEDAVASAFESADAARRRDELRQRLTQVVSELSPVSKKRV